MSPQNDPSRACSPERAKVARLRDPAKLRSLARDLRVTTLTMIAHARSGHTGGSLSCIELLTCLYFAELRHYPFRAEWPGRDRFVLSKGHAAPALYAVLQACGYLTSDDLLTLRRLESILQGHPDSRRCPGVEASTGSLGQGLSVAHGMALALRDYRSAGQGAVEPPRVYALLGDGELQEGQVWEAAMSAGHYRSNNLCAMVDLNGLQIDGRVREIMNVEPVVDKFAAFGWRTFDVDGHDVEQILAALDGARAHVDGPSVIVARTIKGKGVSFCEDRVEWHGKAPNEAQLAAAIKELGASLEGGDDH